MKIQPTHNKVLHNCFGNRQVSTKLPKTLRVKPKYKAPKGLLIALIPLSLLGFGTYYWQTHKQEAMQKYWENIFKPLLKSLGIELPSSDTNTKDADTMNSSNMISSWKALSTASIQIPNTISMQEALEKYGVQNKDLTPKQDSNTTSWQEPLFKYVKLPENNTESPARD